MNTVKISPAKIKGWGSFHQLFAETFHFPDYYGKNMNAWIDCMEELIAEPTLLDFGDCRKLNKSHPEIIEAILSCTAFINYRQTQAGNQPLILISMYI